MSGTDRIWVHLAYCDPDQYSYRIEDADTIHRILDLVKDIDGKDLFCTESLYGLEVCATFYSGDSELFYIGLGWDCFESGSKIKDHIEGVRSTDGYYYANGTPREPMNLLKNHEWGSEE